MDNELWAESMARIISLDLDTPFDIWDIKEWLIEGQADMAAPYEQLKQAWLDHCNDAENG